MEKISGSVASRRCRFPGLLANRVPKHSVATMIGFDFGRATRSSDHPVGHRCAEEAGEVSTVPGYRSNWCLAEPRLSQAGMSQRRRSMTSGTAVISPPIPPDCQRALGTYRPYAVPLVVPSLPLSTTPLVQVGGGGGGCWRKHAAGVPPGQLTCKTECSPLTVFRIVGSVAAP